MQRKRAAMLLSLYAVLALSAKVTAEIKVELKGVHLCCPSCVKAVGIIVQGVEGVTATCDRDAKTVIITAPDAKTAQKTLDALAAGGFHGDTGNKELAMQDDSGATKGKVKSLSVSGVHNCCASCTRILKAALQKVDGVTGDTAKPKEASFEVTGDFDAADLIKTLNAAGFHAKVKK